MTLRDELRVLIGRYGKAKIIEELYDMPSLEAGKYIAVRGPFVELKIRSRTSNALLRSGVDTIARAVEVSQAGYPECLEMPFPHPGHNFGPLAFADLTERLIGCGYLPKKDADLA